MALLCYKLKPINIAVINIAVINMLSPTMVCLYEEVCKDKRLVHVEHICKNWYLISTKL